MDTYEAKLFYIDHWWCYIWGSAVQRRSISLFGALTRTPGTTGTSTSLGGSMTYTALSGKAHFLKCAL